MSHGNDAIASAFGGRSRNGWSDKPVTQDQIRQLYDIVKLGRHR